MKKAAAIVLALAMCLILLPASALAAKDTVTLSYTIRDFNADGVLFEGEIASQSELVKDTLGADKKPVYNLPLWREMFGESVTQSDLNAFFHDVPGKNNSAQKTLAMQADGQGYWVIDSSFDAAGNELDGFFPIDNELFGNEGRGHNYHFSVEIHTKFKYVEGAEFEFSGDDDVWVFFNNKRVIDLGGVHGAASASVTLAEVAPELGIAVGDIVNFDMFYMERHETGSNLYIRTNFEFLNLQASAWAQGELAEADALGLIPECLEGADLTKRVNRAEFAAICVKVYESLTDTKTAVPAVNPFTDCTDKEVLKAYNTGITNGKYDNGARFAPTEGLNRQEAATMLTRTYKRATMPGWTLSADSSFPLTFTKPAAFKDDGQIGGFARDSVYFMAANNIIKGYPEDNTFRPKNTTTVQEANGYASATRQQALVIAVRLVKNLGA